MRALLPLSALALLVSGCGDDPKPAVTEGTDTQEAADLAAPDTSPDTTADPSPDTADTTPDTAPDVTTPDVSTPGGPGAPCAEDADCAGPTPKCLGLPGGYCAPDCANAACPEGSVCYEFDDGASLCLASCERNSDCRAAEGHICDTDDTCWWYESTATGTSPVGGPCRTDEDCKDPGAVCYAEGFDGNANGFVGGYCLIFECSPTSCPEGSTCLTVTSDGDTACFASCAGGLACPQAAGYVCTESETCWPGCASDSDCPADYGCHPEVEGCVYGWSNTPFVCDDERLEPNDVAAKAAAVEAPSLTSALDLCADDEDWYSVEAPRRTLTTVGIEFPHVRGDLDLLAYDEAGALLGSRLGPESYPAAYRGNENGLEYHAFLNMTDTLRAKVRVKPFSDAQNQYDLHVTTTEWEDGALCTDEFPFDECRGYTGAPEGRLYHFPFARPDDPYVPDGYRLESYSSYRWLRRETIMLVRHAIHAVQQKFPGTTPLGLLDMADKDGVTPGFDVGDPRHPETTHDQGGNVDIAYYQTDGDNDGAIVCGPRESANNDGYFCTSTNGHIMDVPRTTYLIATLLAHPRVRVIGVDALLAPLIEAEAKVQRDAGDITTAQYNAVMSKLAYGDGWPFHHHHLHLSMRWWSQDAAQPNGLITHREPAIGCGFRLPGDGPYPVPPRLAKQPLP